ncbi:MAG: Na/Pi cotransporter family protein, partial [Rhodospirillales bacterium]|nr:Na/Pi cotransporter family protein [Rhodospirillales bacterium]
MKGPVISATQTLIALVGAVALLLWGMRMVRTGVTRAFGSNLRHAIGTSVANRFRALCVGIGVTAILQSSTATALMIASFAGSGLIATAPALAVMLGADIGTTLVAQLLSFDISWASPLLIAGGFIAHSVSLNSRPRQLGRAAIGLGMMLLALKLIVSTAEPLRQSQVLQDLLSSIAEEALIAILIAALLTWLAHSSLAIVLLI